MMVEKKRKRKERLSLGTIDFLPVHRAATYTKSWMEST
jgi:hypothetical protein